jgi:hypothetical protein
MTDEQWYTPKELYEMINNLSGELKSTTEVIKKYNGLHERFDKMDEKLDKQIGRCDKVQTEIETKKDLASTVTKLWPLLMSTILFILAIMNII